MGEWFGSIFRTAWNNITGIFVGIGSWFGRRWDDITAVFTGVGDWFGEKFSGAWKKITSAFASFGEFFGRLWGNIVEIFMNVGDWFKDRFQSAYDGITGIFSGIGDFFYGIWEDVSNKAKDGMNWLMGRVENGINSIIDGINRISFDMPDIFGGAHVGFDLNHVSLPRLANGGIATAPTLAMVGDNRNAQVDPEVISPLSKLKTIVGNDNPEVVELLRSIAEMLRSGLTAELAGTLFGNDFRRTVLKICAEENARRGL